MTVKAAMTFQHARCLANNYATADWSTHDRRLNPRPKNTGRRSRGQHLPLNHRFPDFRTGRRLVADSIVRDTKV